jgi:hypothetical protein
MSDFDFYFMKNTEAPEMPNIFQRPEYIEEGTAAHVFRWLASLANVTLTEFFERFRDGDMDNTLKNMTLVLFEVFEDLETDFKRNPNNPRVKLVGSRPRLTCDLDMDKAGLRENLEYAQQFSEFGEEHRLVSLFTDYSNNVNVTHAVLLGLP